MTPIEGEVYLVETTDNWSIIGEYAGTDEDGVMTFVPGPLSPIGIPETLVATLTPIEDVT